MRWLCLHVQRQIDVCHESYRKSEAQYFDFSGVELVACSGDHQPILRQRALNHLGLFHQLL